jgi:hypothetical protein
LNRYKFNMKKILINVLLLSSVSAWAQDAYICMPTAKTGFIFKSSSNQWEMAKFRTDGDKNILKKTNGEWQWSKFGERYSFSTCNSGGDTESKDGFNQGGFMF